MPVIDIEVGSNGDAFLEWDWSESEAGGDNWKEDYLPDEDDVDDYPDDLEYWGMRGCAVGITDSGDYMVAGTARLDMSGAELGEYIDENYQLFLSIFDDENIDGPYNTTEARNGIASENWWLFGTSNHDEGVSIRQWASGTCLPSNALVVVGTQRRRERPESWRIYVGYMPYGSSNDLEELSDSHLYLESGISDELAVSYSHVDKTLQVTVPDSRAGSASLELYDISGRLTGRTVVILNGSNSVDVPLASVSASQIPNGMYIALITATCNCVILR